MCGRYRMTQHPLVPEIFRRIGVIFPEDGWVPRWNVAPTQPAWIVLSHRGERRAETAKWGFVPWFEKNPKPRLRPINAKIETVRSSGMFKAAFQRDRCLVPATGFYEWEGPPERRLPWLFERDGAPFFFAGLASRWRPLPEAPAELNFTLLTQPAWAPVLRLHDRAPVIVEPEDAAAWLEGSPEEAAAVVRPAGGFSARRVSTALNQARNEGEELDRPGD